MRWTKAAATAGALAAAPFWVACWAGPVAAQAAAGPHAGATIRPASAAACYAFAVRALRQRVIVRRMPPACTGLSPEQVNEAVSRAIRTIVGPLPKAAARKLAVADSRYLGSLIRLVRPPAPAPLPTSAAAQPATAAARLAALGTWLAAAAAGSFLLARRLTRDGRRRVRVTGAPPWLAAGHAGLAVAGLCIWIVFVVTTQPVLGWLAAVVSWVIAGLGMATLLADAPGSEEGSARPSSVPPAASAAAFPARVPVLMIALHGALATATIVFVLLALIGVG